MRVALLGPSRPVGRLRPTMALALACATFAACGCGAPDHARTAFERDMRLRGYQVLAEGRNGMVRLRRGDGAEIWADLDDRRMDRFHGRDREPCMMVVGGGLLHRPAWVPSYPGGRERPEFAELKADGTVSGSWMVETRDDPETVRRFYADTLGGLGLDVRPGAAPVPTPEVRAFLEAVGPGGARRVHVRVEDHGSAGTLAEVYCRVTR